MSADLYLIRKEAINISHCIRHISADDFIARRSWSSVCAASTDKNLANSADEMDRRLRVPAETDRTMKRQERRKERTDRPGVFFMVIMNMFLSAA